MIGNWWVEAKARGLQILLIHIVQVVPPVPPRLVRLAGPAGNLLASARQFRTGCAGEEMSEDFPTPSGDSTAGLPDATLRALNVGQLIAGRFRLVRPLGKGGMGVVWLAQDESLAEEVAFKFLNEAITHDSSAIFELKREVKRSRQLTHPHIIRVHDLIEDHERGLAGITMEVAAGGTLADRRVKTEHGWFEPHEIAAWTRQLCEALDYAHRTALLVHRDLKPANLLLDAAGRLKLSDIGISAGLHGTTVREWSGQISGTLAFMSPEQAQGQPPAPADDLYALGATIYQLLSGTVPVRFHPRMPLTAQVGMISHEPVPPMTARRREEDPQAAELPLEWESTVAALLAKEAADRPASAGEAAALLGLVHAPRIPAAGPVRVTRAAADSPAPAEAETLPPPNSALPHRRWIGATVAGLAGLLALGAWVFWPPPSVPATAAITTSPTPRAITTSTSEHTLWPVGSKISKTPRPAPNEFGYLASLLYTPYSFLGPFGYVDQAGQTVVPLRWTAAGDFSEGLAQIEENGKSGYLDPTGRVVIPPHWEYATSFTGGFAQVKDDAQWAYIDRSGSVISRWDSTSAFSEGLAWVRQNDKYGFIDPTGQFVARARWDSASSFSERMAAVKEGSKWGYLNANGVTAIPPRWDEAFSFSEGLARVQVGVSRVLQQLAAASRPKRITTLPWVPPPLVGTKKKTILSPDSTEEILNEPSATFGYIDMKGTTVIEPRYSDGEDFSEGLAAVREPDSEGGKRWGYLDRTGQLVIPFQFEEATSFHGGLARVKQGRYYGYIDKAGILIIPPQWEDAGSFNEGMARVMMPGGKYGLTDPNGQLVVPAQWDYIAPVISEKNNQPYSYYWLYRELSADKILVVLLASDRREIWRAELPMTVNR